MNDNACRLKSALWRTANNVPEVDNRWVAAHRADVRLIDIRERAELEGPLGVLGDVEHVPLRQVALAAANWDKDQAIVVLCRSGGRSARAARDLEAMGFTCVASMEGGMMMWQELGLPYNTAASSRV